MPRGAADEEKYMNSPGAKIYVTGHLGMVGSAMVLQLRARRHRHAELFLDDPSAVKAAEGFKRESAHDAHKPDGARKPMNSALAAADGIEAASGAGTTLSRLSATGAGVRCRAGALS
jgi:hypothetical protein